MMILRIRTLADLAGVLALAASLAAGRAEAAYDDVYSAGHGDINLSYDSSSNSLHLNFEFGTNARINGVLLGTGQEREADTITVLVGANGLGVGPAGLPAPFANNPLYTLPQTSQAGRPFLGFGAEEIEPGLFQGADGSGLFTYTLTGISQRPAGGEVVVWQAGAEASPFFNSADGLTAADRLIIEAGGHDHYNYGFTQQGVYDLNLTATGTLNDGTVLSTTATYRFQVVAAATVVPEPGSLTLMGLGFGSAGLLLSRRGKGKPGPVVAG